MSKTVNDYLNQVDFESLYQNWPSMSETWNDLECLKKCNDKAEMFEMIKEKKMSVETDLLWKHIYKFASKFNLATICIAIPEAVKHQLEMDFTAAYPKLNFEEEWQKVKEGKS